MLALKLPFRLSISDASWKVADEEDAVFDATVYDTGRFAVWAIGEDGGDQSEGVGIGGGEVGIGWFS